MLRRQVETVSSARRDVVRACRLWCPLTHDLHRFLIAISRTVVNLAGRLACLFLRWFEEGRVQVHRATSAVRDVAGLPAPLSGHWASANVARSTLSSTCSSGVDSVWRLIDFGRCLVCGAQDRCC